MSFPTDPRDVAVELYVNSGWVDITPDVYLRDGIRITRGRANEASAVAPSMCKMTINNRSGRYSPRNAVGPYYGSIGRNTPLRLAVRTERDSFARTVSSGWGTADTGGAWTGTGGGTTVPADFNVAAGVGTHSIPAVNAFRFSYLAGSVYRDVDVSAQVTLPFATVLGGPVEPATLVVSGLTSSDYFMAQTAISTAGAVSVKIVHVDGTVVVATTTVAGLTYTGQALKARMQVEGQTLRAKLWDGTLPEPYAWTVEGRTDRLAGRAAGWVGVRSGVAAGNTNPLPVVFSYDAVEVRSCRFAGEVSTWPQQWDLSGADVSTPIEAAGLLRRLGQGATPLKSTYRRGNVTMSPPPLAYWPVEDGSASTQIASGISGSPMLVDGPAQFAQSSDFVGSAPIAKVNGSAWTGDVPGAPNTGVIQTVFLMSVPSTGETAESAVIRVNCSGTAPFWDLIYTSGGNLRLKAYDSARVQLLDSGFITFTVDGSPRQVSVTLTQNGANVDWGIATLVPGSSTGLTASNTLAGRTVGALTGIIVNPYKQLTGTAIGHVMSRTYSASIFSLKDQLKAYAGESAKDRMVRLCAENNIPFTWLWDGAIASAAMGPQGRDTLLNLIGECADADMGSLYEQRSTMGLGCRMRSGTYNQSPSLALDYAAGHLSPPFQPVDDDQALRNDVTVTRTNGSSSEATQTTGPLAVTDPSAGGVGRYDDAVTLNVATDAQVPDAAGWLLHLGTVDEARYPTVKIGLAKLTSRSASLGLAALAVNTDDRITIANPMSGMDPATISQLARGYTEEINAFVHDITFNASPERPWQVMVLDSATLGKLDSDTSTLAAAVGSADTTLFVADSTSTGWTTDPAEMPIPIRVGGETMSVTAVANELLSNTGFEVSLSPWTAAGASSFTQSSTQKHSGSFAARIVPDGVTANVGPSAEAIPVTAGASVTVSAWVWFTSAVTGNYSTSVNWLTSTGVYISTSSVFVSVSAATWTKVTNTFTAPAGAATMAVVPVLIGTPAAAQIWYVDDASLQGPQRFSVTRSTNGVVKAQNSGASVRLTRPSTLAL